MKNFITYFPGICLFLFYALSPQSIAAQSTPHQSNILVPLYTYPSANNRADIWTSIADAQRINRVNVTAIINPDSGPTPTPNADYCAGLHLLSDAEVNVIGYVSTRYLDPGNYDLNCGEKGDPKFTTEKEFESEQAAKNAIYAMVKKIFCNIDLYLNDYKKSNCCFPENENYLSGIFLDEVDNEVTVKLSNNTTITIDLYPYYKQIYDKIKIEAPSWQVFLNAGTEIPERFIECPNPVGDVVITLEQCASAVQDNRACNGQPISSPDPWVYNYDADRFACLLYNAPSGDQQAMENILSKAISENYGYLYLTDKNADWNSLPSYWVDMVDYLKNENESTIINFQPIPMNEIHTNTTLVAQDFVIGPKGAGPVYLFKTPSSPKSFYIQACDKWRPYPNPGIFKAAVAPNGYIWLINQLDQVYRFEKYQTAEENMNATAKEIAVGKDGSVFIIDLEGKLRKWNRWEKNWSDPGREADKVAVDPNGNPWIINNNNIFRFQYNNWVSISGRGQEIAIGGNGAVFMIDQANQLYGWDSANNDWAAYSRSATKVAVDSEGKPWFIDSGQIYKGE